MKYPYYLVDAFTNEIFQGAQIAVFPDADEMTTEQMQLIARELNLSETVFILSHPRGWQLRAFSPQQEIDQPGHQTIAGCYVLALEQRIAEGRSSIVQGDEVIDIAIEKQADAISRVAFSTTAAVRFDDYVPSSRELAEILYLEGKDLDVAEHRTMIASCGGDYLMIPVKSREALRKARFNLNKWTMSFVATLASRILLFTTETQEASVNHVVRLLGKGIGEQEDPPIGAAMPAFGAYLAQDQQEGKFSVRVQRGGDGLRKSILQVVMSKEAGELRQTQVAGQAVLAGKGELITGQDSVC